MSQDYTMRSHDDGWSYMPQDSTTANTSYPMDDASYSRAYHQLVRSTEVVVDYTVAPSFVQLEDGNLQDAMGMSGIWSDEAGAVYDNVIHDEPSQNTMLPAVNGFVPQAPPCVACVVDNMSYRTGSHVALDDWGDASHYPLSISDSTWLSGPPPHQEGAPFPSASPDCSSVFTQDFQRITCEPVIDEEAAAEMMQTSLTGSDPGLGIGSADVNYYRGEYALGAALPTASSVGLDCSLAFKQQGLHYIAPDPDPSSSLMSSVCDRMSSSAEGELRSKSGYDTPFWLSPGFTSLQHIDDGQETGSYFLPPVGNVPCFHNGLDPGGTPFSDDSPENLVHTGGGHNAHHLHNTNLLQQGMAWTTTATPPVANLASVQLAGSSTRRAGAAPSPTPLYQSPSSPDSEDDDLAPTTETPHPKECGHIDAYGRICRKPFDTNRTRHWINEHIMRELKDIQRAIWTYPGPGYSSPMPTFSGQRG
ncbi:hypothetical protein JB92DRAFT_3150405 [Gautieria morchelliformis]|nr:hypothetical protein JB92DRAFT_3150405 [Gautieria morchelliformis]